ncbi:MAG: OmpA family protein [Phycisphaerales bacterium JB037]
MKRINGRIGRAVLLAAAGSAMGLGGCASQREVDDQTTTIRVLEDQKARWQQEKAELVRTIELKDDRIASADRIISELRAEIDGLVGNARSLQTRLTEERAEHDRSIREFESMLNDIDASMVLDPVTDRALARLASQHPDLISYDAQRGMLRFASDLTFDSGSAVVKESAATSLRVLADVLKGAGAEYEIDIVGHTDNQRPGANTQKLHPTNVHLSAHRAIAVRDVLAGVGVPEGRMRVSGWGAQRPLVPNNSNGGTPQNRRVEVYLTRPTGTGGVRSATVTEQGGQVNLDRQTPPTRPIDPTK